MHWMRVMGLTIKKTNIKDVKEVTLNGLDFPDSWGIKEFALKRRVMLQWALDMKRDEYKTDKDNDKKKFQFGYTVHTLLV